MRRAGMAAMGVFVMVSAVAMDTAAVQDIESLRVQIEHEHAEVKQRAREPVEAVVSSPPTPVPTPAPTPVPVVEAHTEASPLPVQGGGGVKDRIRAAWLGDDDKVIRVTGCETGYTWDPTIVGPRANDGSNYEGLFQMDATFWKTYGGLEFAPSPKVASVEAQVTVGWRGYQDRGWEPWPTCGKK